MQNKGNQKDLINALFASSTKSLKFIFVYLLNKTVKRNSLFWFSRTINPTPEFTIHKSLASRKFLTYQFMITVQWFSKYKFIIRHIKYYKMLKCIEQFLTVWISQNNALHCVNCHTKLFCIINVMHEIFLEICEMCGKALEKH